MRTRENRNNEKRCNVCKHCRPLNKRLVLKVSSPYAYAYRLNHFGGATISGKTFSATGFTPDFLMGATASGMTRRQRKKLKAKDKQCCCGFTPDFLTGVTASGKTYEERKHLRAPHKQAEDLLINMFGDDSIFELAFGITTNGKTYTQRKNLCNCMECSFCTDKLQEELDNIDETFCVINGEKYENPIKVEELKRNIKSLQSSLDFRRELVAELTDNNIELTEKNKKLAEENEKLTKEVENLKELLSSDLKQDEDLNINHEIFKEVARAFMNSEYKYSWGQAKAIISRNGFHNIKDKTLLSKLRELTVIDKNNKITEFGAEVGLVLNTQSGKIMFTSEAMFFVLIGIIFGTNPKKDNVRFFI